MSSVLRVQPEGGRKQGRWKVGRGQQRGQCLRHNTETTRINTPHAIAALATYGSARAAHSLELVSKLILAPIGCKAQSRLKSSFETSSRVFTGATVIE